MFDLALIAPQAIRPLMRVEYDRMIDKGILDEDERIELLRGTLVQMTPQGSSHAHVIWMLSDRLSSMLRTRAVVRSHAPLAVSDKSAPEPDIAVVPLGDYFEAHPTTALLVIEVADSSRKKDVEVKPDIYAAAGVPEYWVVDLKKKEIQVRILSKRGKYGLRPKIIKRGKLSPKAFPDIEIDVGEFLR